MKFNILVLFFFIIACSSNYTKIDNRKPYNATGFAYIYNVKDYENKIIKKKLNNDMLQISHKDLRIGTLIKLSNPNTNEYIVLKNIQKIEYPEFYKILITRPVADKLNINNQLPLIEVLEIKKNKSFIAKKAKIYQEEKKISSNAPVDSVQISVISNRKSNILKDDKKKIYILIASFYTEEAANILKQRIINKVSNYDYKKLRIKKKNSKEFDVLSGPYMSINSLKNDYIEIKNFGFEELDIFINE